jgi:hypothetical protein
MPSKREILLQVRFGHQVAEEELDQLSSYFVETDQWSRVLAGEIDIVYGPKGAGKSAIYGLLLARRDALFDSQILLAPAENPQGALAFAGIATDPPTSEAEFRALWKLYLLSLAAMVLDDFDVGSESAKVLRRVLEDQGLLPRGKGLSGFLSAARHYVSKAIRPESVEGTLEIDPMTGLPKGFSGKIAFREPAPPAIESGYWSVDTLLSHANTALDQAGYDLWLLLDRLDVAFAEDQELEHNALRALFRVYLDLAGHSRIHLKIFLRTDIWERITSAGFREASHITRDMTITWDSSSMLNLIVRRAIQNESIRDHLQVNPEHVLASSEKQSQFFYRIFPDQVDVGEKKPSTLDWMLSRTKDGLGRTAPREIIHLLNAIREVQIRRIEQGHPEPVGDLLFESTAFKEALEQVSRARVEQSLLAENPSLRDPILGLKREKATQYPESLAGIWKLSVEQATKTAEDLAQVGFFEIRGTKEQPEYWVPFLFRDALELVQGAADT